MFKIPIPFSNPGLENYEILRGENNPKFGNGVHHYVVRDRQGKEISSIHFQQGALAENSINGVLSVIHLQILIDHLQSFQTGELANRETAIAITKLEEAYLWLAKRSDDRQQRKVLGTVER